MNKALGLLVMPVVVLGLASSAGATQYKHPKMHHWYASQGGKQSINAIGADTTSISNDASANNDAAVGTDCQNLRNDVEIAQNIAPIPSASVQRLWAAALNDYNQGAVQCVNGINDNDANGEIEQATSDFSSGTALLTHLTKSL